MDKTWKWVVYILYLLCGGAIVGAFGYLGSKSVLNWLIKH